MGRGVDRGLDETALVGTLGVIDVDAKVVVGAGGAIEVEVDEWMNESTKLRSGS